MRLVGSKLSLAKRFADVVRLCIAQDGYVGRDYWVSKRDGSIICDENNCDKFGVMLGMGFVDIVGGWIGFNNEVGKWGVFDDSGVRWFGVGSECRFGDACYIPSDTSEHIELVRLAGARWFRGSLEAEDIDGNEVLLKWVYSMDSPLAGRIGHERVRIRRGRGSWFALDMDDALEMAKDYAYNLGRLFEYGVYIK